MICFRVHRAVRIHTKSRCNEEKFQFHFPIPPRNGVMIRESFLFQRAFPKTIKNLRNVVNHHHRIIAHFFLLCLAPPKFHIVKKMENWARNSRLGAIHLPTRTATCLKSNPYGEKKYERIDIESSLVLGPLAGIVHVLKSQFCSRSSQRKLKLQNKIFRNLRQRVFYRLK